MDEPRLFCTFYLGEERYGLEVERVREVIRHGAPSPVPLAPPEVVGLINLRGRITTVIDLGARLGKKPRATDAAGAAGATDAPGLGLVLRAGSRAVSLRIDRVGDVVAVTEGQFEAPPETLKGPARERIRGTYKLDDGLLLALDGDRAIPTLDPA